MLFLGHFDGNTGNSGLDADYAGGSTAVVNAGAVISNTGPKFGAGSLDQTTAGEASWATAGNYDVDEGTVEMWIKPDAWANGLYKGFFSVHGGGTDIRFAKLGDGRLQAYQYDGTNIFSLTTAAAVAPTDAEWHHLAWDWSASGNTSTFYLDGVVVANTVSGTVGSYAGTLPADFEIGTVQSSEGQTFNGLIDEFRISNTSVYGGVNFTPPSAPFEVPEPSSLGLIALGAVALKRRSK
jgi:hypothetical protein